MIMLTFFEICVKICRKIFPDFLYKKCVMLCRKIFPESILYIYDKKMGYRKYDDIEKMQLSNKFSYIYREGIWSSGDKEIDFYSGTGSHNLNIINPYIKGVIEFLAGQNRKLDVVDLGCGDYNIGSQIRPYTRKYVACDIVQELIERNKINYSNTETEFRLVNIVDDDLPEGEVVFLRQVLQHLSNSDIIKILPKLMKYKILILTEHIPSNIGFKPNKDFVSGPGIRLERNSGIVITKPPFNLLYKESEEVCSVEERGGKIVTTIYKLK